MLLTIKNIDSDDSDDSINGELFYDINGNIILKIITTLYYLSIDDKDNLEFIEIYNTDNLITINQSIHLLNIKNTSDKISLRKKIIDEIEYDKEKDGYDSFSDEEETHEYELEYKMFPENKYYYIDGEYKQTKKEYYNFAKADKDMIINMFDKSIDGLANYDTLIINTEINKIHFSSELNNKNAYRITISLDNKFTLNIIGSHIKHFDINYKKIGEDINILFRHF